MPRPEGLGAELESPGSASGPGPDPQQITIHDSGPGYCTGN